MLNTIIFAFVFLSGISFFIFSIKNFLSYIKIGKLEDRTGNVSARFKNLFRIGLMNSKLFRRRFAGFLHIVIFWGFCSLSVIVMESFIEGFLPNFSFAFLGKFYSLITLTQDVFGISVLIVVIFSLFRRYIGTPERLKKIDNKSRLDATFILSLIAMVMITMFGANIERILTGHSHGFRPVSAAWASLYKGGGSETLYLVFWWAHNIVVLGFLNYLPYCKHFHVLSSLPNTFLSNYGIDKKNILKPINFEDESIQQYGAKDIQDLSWKTLLDGYTCTECGRCMEVCPANSTGKLLNPKTIITKTRKRTMEKGPLVAKGITENSVLEKALVPDYITSEELWACTTCAACMEECPVMIDHITAIVEMRRNLALMESDFPQEVNTVFKNLENNESPWAYGPEARNEWIEEFISSLDTKGENVNLKKLSNEGTAENVDVVFWVGCAGAFDQRYRNVTKSFANILNKAGIKFGVLGSEEKCNGDTARRLGNEYLAQMLMTQNAETFAKYNIKKVVTMCPHCLHSLKNEYPQFGAKLEVIHHTEFINNLLNEGKINISKGEAEKITYHDSCYLGRYNGVYDEPRTILGKIGADVVEMKRSKDKGFCCGAGGGRMFMEETEGKRVNIERTEEALDTGAKEICSACPFCMTMLTDGVKAKEKAEEVKVKDVAEYVWQAILK